jgi:hypothetical protein
LKYGIVSHPSTIVHTYGAGRPTPTNTDIRFTDIGLRLEAMEFGIGNAEGGKRLGTGKIEDLKMRNSEMFKNL